MKQRLKNLASLLSEAASEWLESDAPRASAALSFYDRGIKPRRPAPEPAPPSHETSDAPTEISHDKVGGRVAAASR